MNAKNRSRAALSFLTISFVLAASIVLVSPDSSAAPCEQTTTACERWNMKYDGAAPSTDLSRPGFSDDLAQDMAVGGDRVYTTGRSKSQAGGDDYATVAYNATTGAQQWVAREDESDFDTAYAIVYNGPKSLVIVTGEVDVEGSSRQYFTVAYDATSGAKRWEAHQCTGTDPAACSDNNGVDTARDIDVFPDGELIVVTGESQRPAGSTAAGWDFLTIAYDADNGAEVWRKTFNSGGAQFDFGRALDVTADRVFVTGRTNNRLNTARNVVSDWGTVAYRLADGEKQWEAQTGAAEEADTPYDIAASGTRVFVTGEMNGAIATISYTAASGAEEWRHLFGTGGGGRALAVDPAGSHLYVTGDSRHAERGLEITTLRYPVSGPTPTGTKTYENTGDDFARDITVGAEHGQTRVFVTGEIARSSTNRDILVVAYDGGLGDRWARTRGSDRNDQARTIALGSGTDLTSVFSAGSVDSVGTNFDYDTAAYDASVSEPSPTASPSSTPSSTPTQSSSPTQTPSQTPSHTPSQTPSNTTSQTPSRTPSQTPSNTPSHTPSPTLIQTPSRTPTATPPPATQTSPTPTPPPDTTGSGRPECDDAVDNDDDGFVDRDDPDCEDINDDSERPEARSCAGVTAGTRTARAGGGLLIGGTAGDDTLLGSDGPDIICGFGGKDFIRGMDDEDLLDGGAGKDTVVGGSEADRLLGRRGSDVLNGNSGNDKLRGHRGRDALQGGAGADNLLGRAGEDLVRGGAGDDVVSGGNHSDVLKGLAGNDRLLGGKGADALNGGRGTDRCRSGPGRDRVRRCE